MILRHVAHALRRQDWFAVVIEFVLLVLGVLLALYLNNLSQQNAEQKLLQNYLEQLVQDLSLDSTSNKRIAEKTHDLDEHANYFLAAIQGTNHEPLSESRLTQVTLLAGYANLPVTFRATFEELVSTGNLRLFKDNELKRAITDYYNKSEQGRQWDGLIRSVQIDYRRITRDLLSHEQFRWARQNATGDFDTPIELDIPVYLEKARANPELIGVISAMAEIQQRVRDDCLRKAEYATTLIERIEMSLN